MRIIAGSAKGTTLKAAAEGTRPMTGRARESLFSIIAGHLPAAEVLDLYAGSGSLGLEALSRGATEAVFVEWGRHAARILKENVDSVGLGGLVVERGVESAMQSLHRVFDVVFIDPPYADEDAAVESVLGQLDRLLAPDGLIVVHRQARSAFAVPEFLTSTDERRYGDAVITMLERTVG
jgi:16S rRNA (guanine966-N2)-methyltransferase